MPSNGQTRSGSGFGRGTTASQVLREIDLSGQHAVVTGGYSGIGLATTQALVAAGATVSVPARRPDLAAEQLSGLSGVQVAEMDLTDLASVRSYASTLLDAGRHVDMLINNAGVMAAPLTRVGPGWEFQLATNYLGHYALVNHLWPILTGGSRVVSVSSRGHFYSQMRWNDPMFDRTPYDRWAAYGQSKTANALLAVHLDRLGRDAGVRAFALHPGIVLTPLTRYLSRDDLVSAGAMDAAGNLVPENGLSPEEGAATQVWAATSPQLAGRGGLYLEDVEVAEMFDPRSQGGSVQPYAVDAVEAERLWRWSATLTDVNAFA